MSTPALGRQQDGQQSGSRSADTYSFDRFDTKYRENTVESWNMAIEDGLEFRRQYAREAQWAKCEAIFYQANKMQLDNVGPNIIAASGDALLSTLLTPNPSFVLHPLRMNLVEATPILERQLNTFIYTLGLKSVEQAMVLHAYLYGVGIAKIGYDSEFGYDTSEDLGKHANTILGLSLTQFDKKGNRLEYDSRVEPGMPWVMPVLPHDFVVPWGTVNLSNCPWCAHRIVRHIDDIKRDPKYSNTRDLAPQMSMSDYVKSYLNVMKPYRMGVVSYSNMTSSEGRRQGTDRAEFVELWEVHDLRTGRVMVIAQGHDKFLRNDVDYLQEDGLPFVSLSFVPRARTFWTTPDVVYLQSHQEEVIDIATMTRKQRRISTMRFFYEEGVIDNDELEKFMSSEIGIGVKYKAGSGNTPVIPITPSNNNNQLQNEAEYVLRNARTAVGLSRNQAGEYEATGRRTASEAMIVQQNSDQRLDRRQDALAETLCDIGKKLAKIVMKFWQTPRLIDVLGPDGASQWTSFTGSDLKGEYLYKINFSSEPLKGIEARKQEAMQLYSGLAQDPTIDPLALRRYLVNAWNDPNFTSLFKPGVVSNANLQSTMQQLLLQQSQQGGGQVPGEVPEGGGGGPGQVPSVPQTPQPGAVPSGGSGVGPGQGV